MADAADRADDEIEAALSVALATCTFPVAVGRPGVCSECCEPRPRLVMDRCAYCRDGRPLPEDGE